MIQLAFLWKGEPDKNGFASVPDVMIFTSGCHLSCAICHNLYFTLNLASNDEKATIFDDRFYLLRWSKKGPGRVYPNLRIL